MEANISQLVGTVVRTLLAAGYIIENSRRQPNHIEIMCNHKNILGAKTNIFLALTDNIAFGHSQIDDLNYCADSQGRSLVLVAREGSNGQLSWQEFFDALGGEIPSWRALSGDYSQALAIASRNVIPTGMSGEAWLIFEDLVADGLEFILGRRVRRLGGRKRGRAVSDMLAQGPDGKLYVIDTKAYSEGFDANTSSLRALGEYVSRQIERQRGHNEVYAALIVSSSFHQDVTSLMSISLDFRSKYSVPVAFIGSHEMAQIIEVLRNSVSIRNGIRWHYLFRGGQVRFGEFKSEVANVKSERYEGDKG